MSEVFGPAYAGAYDLLYRDKDYAAECDLLERAFKTYGSGPVRTVLDLGCGTGGHALLLAGRGYAVTGVDRSAEMLAIARSKAAGRTPPVDFRQADIRDLDLQQTFDAAIMMFAVLGYQLEDGDAAGALRSARRHLRAGAPLVLDAWYGPAVLAQKPERRTRTVEAPDGRIVRTAEGRLDLPRQVCTVSFGLRRMRGGAVLAETREEHAVRYFFRGDLERFLAGAGFALARLGAFPDLEREPDESTWSVTAVARALA